MFVCLFCLFFVLAFLDSSVGYLCCVLCWGGGVFCRCLLWMCVFVPVHLRWVLTSAFPVVSEQKSQF